MSLKQLLNYFFSSHFKKAAFVLLTSAPCLTFAGSANWSTTNIQVLKGSGYELGLEDRTIVTLEHANSWKYGDNFFFIDQTDPNGFYSEFSPRFSFSKIMGKETSKDVFVKDVLLSFNEEFSSGGRTYLYGVGVDFNIPNFAFFKTNYYFRDEGSTSGETGQQITIAWLLPFKTGDVSWAFEGFFDYAFGFDEDVKESNIVTAPRLLVDVGSFFGSPGTLQAGVEYQIWRNKFGKDGVNEAVPQAMLKWIW